MKLPTPLEAAARADEGHAIASGLGLDEVAALLRSMARGSSGSDEALVELNDLRQWQCDIHVDGAVRRLIGAAANEIERLRAVISTQAQAGDK